MHQALQITPFMHVPDLEAALAFFVDVLGFRVVLRHGNYAYIGFGDAHIRMLEDPDAAVATRATRRFSYYIDVRDVDVLHRDLKPKLDTLPPADVHGPADKPYGQRELLVVVPDGQILAFGQAIA
ncbi:MAG TPA: VOC family protein [Pseudomonadota bacterium]|nr:VOC family protein [Pseudomonadota bacterium]